MRTLFTRKLLLTSFFFEEVPGDVKNVFMGGLPTSRVMLCLSITTLLSLVTRKFLSDSDVSDVVSDYDWMSNGWYNRDRNSDASE